MFELKELLIALGIATAPITGNQGIDFYKQKLQQEIIHEQKIQEDLKQLEYKRIWTEAVAEEKKDFVAKWFKKNKANEQVQKSKDELEITRKKIAALKQIIEKDSLSRISSKTFTL